MMKWLLLVLTSPFFYSSVLAAPVKLIIDTDIASDCDDAGAVAMANQLMRLGEAEILAMTVSTGGTTPAPALSAINTWYGHGAIPIGTLKKPDFWSGGQFGQPSGAQNFASYTPYLAKEFPAAFRSGDDAPDALDVYRKVLATQPDQSVVINTLGPLINLAHLLESPEDTALVKAKVRLLVIAGGKNPEGTSSNFSKMGAGPYAKRVIDNWPTPVIFVGNEVGGPILSGWPTAEPGPKENPARAAYRVFHAGDSKKKRASADQAGVLYAIRGNGKYFELVTGGYQSCTEDGQTRWVEGTPPAGQRHAYLRKLADDKELQSVFESLMQAE